jgi:hypothetical protein
MRFTLIRYGFVLLSGLVAGYILSQIVKIIEALQHWSG